MAQRKRNNAELEEIHGSEPNQKLAKVEDCFEKWNDLPNELKEKCIIWMELKTKLRLGMTCKTEKKLVHSSNADFDTISFTWNTFKIGKSAASNIEDDVVFKFHYSYKSKNCLPILSWILNHCKIETIKIHSRSFLDDEFLESLAALLKQSLKLKVLRSRDYGCDKAMFFLRRCTKVDYWEVNVLRAIFPVEEFYSIPSVQSASHSLILNPVQRQVDTIWLRNGLKTGSRMRFDYTDRFEIALLCSDLAELGLANENEYNVKRDQIPGQQKEFLTYTHRDPNFNFFTMQSHIIPSGFSLVELLVYNCEAFRYDSGIMKD